MGDSDERKFGYTAFARSDIDDAKRRGPASDLRGWATARGLDYRGQDLPGAFASVLPPWPQHLENMATGALPDGRLGAIAHRLYELETSEGAIRASGDFWGTRVVTRRSFKAMIGLGDDIPTGPFDGNRAFAPSTIAVARAPESAVLPRFVISNSSRMPVGNPSLKQLGLPDLRMYASRFIDDQMFERLATAVAPALQPFDDALVEVRVSYGAIALTVNGYRDDPAELDGLINAVGTLADGLAQVSPAKPGGSAGFGIFWGPATPAEHGAGFHINPPEYNAAYERVAGELHMHQEDTYGFHLRLANCPIPGVASGVLFGSLPPGPDGSATPARLSWHVQGGHTSGTIRPAASFQAPEGAIEGPLGGSLDPATDMYTEIVDGLVFTWARDRIAGRLDSADLLTRAIQLRDQLLAAS